MKTKTRNTDCKEWVLLWNVKESEFRAVPLQIWIQGMQEAFIKGLSGTCPVLMLGLVKSRQQAQELTNKLATCREAFCEIKEEITTAIA